MSRWARRVAMGVGVVGVVVIIAATLALEDFLLIPRYEARLQRDPDAEGNWELSEKLEGLGKRGRKVAESWYLQGLDRWASRGDVDNVLAAVVRLGEIRSRRAIPVLGRIIANRNESESLPDIIGVEPAWNWRHLVSVGVASRNPPSVEDFPPLWPAPEYRLALRTEAKDALRKIEESKDASPR